jgi:hypothetical protein
MESLYYTTTTENVLHYSVLVASVVLAFTVAKGRERIRVAVALAASIVLQIITCKIFYCGGVCVIYSVMFGLACNLAKRTNTRRAIYIAAAFYGILVLAAIAAIPKLPTDRRETIRIGLISFTLHTFLFLSGYGIGCV